MTRGPTITYVTDPSLDGDTQRSVLRELIDASREYSLRVAIRLPGADEEAVMRLVEWYLTEADDTPMLPPMIHNRVEVVARYPQSQLWLPSRMLAADVGAPVWSVHSYDDAVRAKEHGATEVIFGHVFATDSHPGEAGRGVDALRQVASIPDLTVTAIGGIDEHTIGLIEVASVACIRAISQSPDIANNLHTMRTNWKGPRR